MKSALSFLAGFATGCVAIVGAIIAVGMVVENQNTTPVSEIETGVETDKAEAESVTVETDEAV